MAEISGMCVLKWSIDLMNDGEAYEGDLDKKKNEIFELMSFWVVEIFRNFLLKTVVRIPKII